VAGKRVIVCTAAGVVAGVVCWLGSYLAGGVPGGLTTGTILAIVFNRAFLGFAVGISGWRAPWALHGIVIGLAASLQIAIFPLFAGEGVVPFLMYELAGGFWGFAVELVARALGAGRK
jgi:hypothetical protein